jgi:hypothetical protein
MMSKKSFLSSVPIKRKPQKKYDSVIHFSGRKGYMEEYIHALNFTNNIYKS